jgi:hypothetical protein
MHMHECQRLCHIVVGSDRLASCMGSFNSANKTLGIGTWGALHVAPLFIKLSQLLVRLG